MQNTFVQGLEVTAIGMGLVFLTLIVVMIAITLLDRAFRVKPEAEAPADLSVTEARGLAAPLPEATPLASDEAAAIITAIALERAKAGEAAAIAVAVRLEQARQNHSGQDVYTELDAETVTVAAIEPRQGGWANLGRLQATTTR